MANETRKQLVQHLHNLNGSLSVLGSFILNLDSDGLDAELQLLHEAAKRNLQNSTTIAKELAHLVQSIEKK